MLSKPRSALSAGSSAAPSISQREEIAHRVRVLPPVEAVDGGCGRGWGRRRRRGRGRSRGSRRRRRRRPGRDAADPPAASPPCAASARPSPKPRHGHPRGRGPSCRAPVRPSGAACCGRSRSSGRGPCAPARPRAPRRLSVSRGRRGAAPRRVRETPETPSAVERRTPAGSRRPRRRPARRRIPKFSTWRPASSSRSGPGRSSTSPGRAKSGTVSLLLLRANRPPVFCAPPACLRIGARINSRSAHRFRGAISLRPPPCCASVAFGVDPMTA